MSNHTVRNSIGSIANFAAQARHLFESVSRLGEQRRRQRTSHAARQVGLVSAGLALGAGLTTLFTPNTGVEVRRRLSDQANRVRDYLAPRSNGRAPRAARNRKELP